jgi:hypothetical protein
MKNAVSEERRFTQYLHGATSQKTAFFGKVGSLVSLKRRPHLKHAKVLKRKLWSCVTMELENKNYRPTDRPTK